MCSNPPMRGIAMVAVRMDVTWNEKAEEVVETIGQFVMMAHI